MPDECQSKAGPNKKKIAKSVEFPIVTSPDHGVETHAPSNGYGAADENHLHEAVVNGDEVREQIQITSHEHNSVQFLSLARNP